MGLQQETIHIDKKIETYERKLSALNDEELSQEFCDRIGNECGELDALWEHKGRGEIVNELVVYYTCDLLDVGGWRK